MQHGKQRVIQKAAYIEELTGLVRAGKSKGQGIPDLQKSISPAELKSLQGSYGEFLMSSLGKYLLQVPGTSGESLLDGAVRGNIPEVFNRLDA